MGNNRSSLWQIYKTVKFTPFYLDKTSCSLTVLLCVWNTFGEIQSRGKNRVLEHKVLKRLRNKRINYTLLWGGSVNMHYREKTIAFKVNKLNVAKNYAKFANQNAFYVVKTNQLYLVKTMGREKPLKLESFKEYIGCYPPRTLKFGKNQALAE